MKYIGELVTIFEEIRNLNYTIEYWREIESSDQFQSNHYCGGFESTEDEFTFSYFDENDKEFWFQINLDDIINKKIDKIELIDPEKED
jgi:hypothetical protein